MNIKSISFQSKTKKYTKTNSGNSRRIARAKFKQRQQGIIMDDIIRDYNLRTIVPNKTIIILKQPFSREF